VHREAHGVLLAADADHRARGRAVLDGVADEVLHELLEPVRVPDARQVAAGLEPHDGLRVGDGQLLDDARADPNKSV
jgi:hypothetical protein